MERTLELPGGRRVGDDQDCERAWTLRNTDPRRARALAAEAVARAAGGGNELARARAHVVLGTLDVLRSQGAAARPVLERALASLERLHDHVGCARARIALANAAVADDDIAGAEAHARDAVDRARLARDRGLQFDALITMAQVRARSGEYRRALWWAGRAARFLADDDLSRSGQLLAFKTHLRFLSDSPADVIPSFRESLVLAQRSGNDRLRCFILTLLCRAEAELGDYTSALEHALENARLAELLEMPATLARAYTAVGIIHKRFGDYDRAREFAEKARAIARAIDNRMLEASSLNAVGNCLYATGAYDEAMQRYREAECIADEIHDRELQSDLLLNIGNVLRDQRKFDEAFEQYSASLVISREMEDMQRSTELQLNFGRLNSDQGLLDEAITCLERAREMAVGIGNSSLLASTLADLADCYERKGDAARALATLREHIALKNDLTSVARQREIAVIESRAAAERIEREREAERFERERLALEVRHRNEELTSLGVHLAERNELIREVTEHLRFAAEAEPEELTRTITMLLARLSGRDESENSWEEFEQRMQTVHHGFLVTLSERFPELRPAELKIAALLRTQLSSKEIASLLNVSVRAVEKHRYSLRRKLGLPAEQNLVAYLTGMAGGIQAAGE